MLDRIGHLCDYVLWDEAWIGYNAFHPLFDNHSPMRLKDLSPESAGLFSTQSVHKQLAGFSQASQIHKRDEHIRGQRRYVEHKRFNEAFMINASTSPFYPLFASLDVNAKIHEGKAGEMLWDRCIGLSIEARKKFREFGHHYAEHGKKRRRTLVLRSVRTGRRDDPWFEIHGRRHRRAVGRACRRTYSSANSSAGTSIRRARWHGYAGYSEDYAMVDPNKLMLVTPGIDRKTGDYLDYGVPATVVANYLREQRVVPEKCDLNSILFLMTPAEDESKLNTLIARLVKFKNLWDRDAPLGEALPTLYAAHSERYAGYTLQADLQRNARRFIGRRTSRICSGSASARRVFRKWRCCRRMHTKRSLRATSTTLPLDQIEGRISATLALIYPPGIGIVLPGERWDARAKPMLDYFLAFQEAFNRFPGFNYEVQGVYQEREDGRIRFYTYVVRE